MKELVILNDGELNVYLPVKSGLKLASANNNCFIF